MNTFWQLFKESVIVQAVIALSTLLTILYLYITGQEVPNTLLNVFLLVMGYYFGSKTQQSITKGG